MKKIITFLWLAILFQSTLTMAQISLDKVVVTEGGIGGSFYTAQISATETKYVVLDLDANTFGLYNMDFTPFLLNIAVPEPFAATTDGFQPIYITRSLFDCDDSNIEYAYESPLNLLKPFRIMRTDGTELFKLDSANGPYCLGGCLGMSDMIVPIRNTSDGTKLFLQRATLPPTYNVYSLCGTLPTDVFEFNRPKQSLVTIFPNPTTGTLTFRINPPDNINEYDLILVDTNAKELKRQRLNSSTGDYTIDVSNFSNGTYYYTLCTKTKVHQTGKFVVSK